MVIICKSNKIFMQTSCLVLNFNPQIGEHNTNYVAQENSTFHKFVKFYIWNSILIMKAYIQCYKCVTVRTLVGKGRNAKSWVSQICEVVIINIGILYVTCFFLLHTGSISRAAKDSCRSSITFYTSSDTLAHSAY